MDAFLEPLPPDRRDAIKSWFSSSLADCITCGQPVLVGQGHELRKENMREGLAHRSCPIDDTPEAPEEEVPIAVIARAARADWG